MPRTLLAVIGLAGALLSSTADAAKFYDDDPLLREPSPVRVETIKSRKVNDYFDFFSNTLLTMGERSTPVNRIPASGVNTMGEVMDGAWYVNRHYRKRMSMEELRRGPDGPNNAPSETGSWRIVGAKTQGVTPGFTIVDSRGVRYLLKFDPPSNPEMATATDVIGTHFFYALGYHVPENYIVNFPAERLVLDPKTTFIDGFGKKRRMTNKDVFEVMRVIPRNKDGNFRGTMSLYLKGSPVGERRFHGTRSDDPNDIVPHEHRRDLRGFYVLCAWLGHDDSRSINSLDMLVDDGPNRYVRHYLIDFGSILGSASTKSNSARSGADYLFSWHTAARELFTLGIWVPKWAQADFPDLPAVGKFEYEVFDPGNYRPEYPNPAFQNRDTEDEFWGAKQVMQFTDEEIAAIVQLGQYSDPRSAEWITKCLIERRNKIGKTYFSRVLPLDRFNVRDGQLQFEDLGVLHKLVPARTYGFVWSRFDNQTVQKTPITGAAGPSLPAEVANAAGVEYFAADISGSGNPHQVTVYLRKSADGVRVIGLDRTQK